jgi:hypothetical protein
MHFTAHYSTCYLFADCWFHQSLLGNGSQHCRSSCFNVNVLTGCCLTAHSGNSLPLTPCHVWPPLVTTHYNRLALISDSELVCLKAPIGSLHSFCRGCIETQPPTVPLLLSSCSRCCSHGIWLPAKCVYWVIALQRPSLLALSCHITILQHVNLLLSNDFVNTHC